MGALASSVALLGLMAVEPRATQPARVDGTVFAMIDQNEWCPGGSVYLDLHTVSYMMYPRQARPACADQEFSPAIEHGILDPARLGAIQDAYLEARRAGLKRKDCELVISNGGPQAVVITAPGYSAATPEELGCWSTEATALHDRLFEAFGKQR